MRINFFIICILNALILLSNGTPLVTREVEFGNMKLVLSKKVMNEIQKQVNALTSSPKYYQMKIDRMLLYFPIIERIFKEEGVPEDFKYLAIQESGLISDAVSSADAVGFWQFKDFTAREVGLRVDKRIDERKNIIASSRGAAKYLKRHNLLVDNWIYAMSAYQAGMGGARKYMNKSKYGNRKLEINSSTHWYVKKFIAHKIAFENRVNDTHSKDLYLIEFDKGANKTLGEIAKELGLDVNLLRTYNKWILYGEIPKNKTYTVLIPTYKKVENKTISQLPEIAHDPNVKKIKNEKKIFPSQMLQNLLDYDSKYLTYNDLNAIISGNSNNLYALTAEAGIPTQLFMKYNDIKTKDSIKSNTIYYLEGKKFKSKIGFHVVKKSETLWSISQKYAVRLNRLMAMNRITTNEKIEINRVLWLNAKRPKKIPIQYHNSEKKDEITVKKEMYISNTYNEDLSEQSEKTLYKSTPSNEKISEIKNIHTVMEGETLWSVARKYNISVNDLKAFNKINDNKTLSIGQDLYIFSTQKETPKSKKTNIYTVKEGDSFYSIANDHNMSVKELMILNKRINDIILIGDKLKVNPN